MDNSAGQSCAFRNSAVACKLNRMGEILLLSVSGHDKPGVARALLAVLEKNGARVLDLGQAVVHEALALGMLVETDGSIIDLQEQVLAVATTNNVAARFSTISSKDFESWTHRSERQRLVVTVLAPSLTAGHLAKMAGVLTDCGLNIEAIERLSSRESLLQENGRACVQFRVSGERADLSGLRAKCLRLAQETGIDVAIQDEAQYGRSRRLIAFDMDSTLIQAEIIDELARMKGVGEEVSRVTEAAMRGEIDFKQSFTRRLSLLRGLPEQRVYELLERVPMTDGAERLIRTLKAQGYKTAILSGGFTFFGRHLQQRLGIDYLHANELEMNDGIVTGNVIPPIMDGQRKAEMLKKIAEEQDIPLEQAIAVGDGANDLPMLNLAGMGIAFRAKPVVRQNAQHAISSLGLDAILYLLGIRDRDTF